MGNPGPVTSVLGRPAGCKALSSALLRRKMVRWRTQSAQSSQGRFGTGALCEERPSMGAQLGDPNKRRDRGRLAATGLAACEVASLTGTPSLPGCLTTFFLCPRSSVSPAVLGWGGQRAQERRVFCGWAAYTQGERSERRGLRQNTQLRKGQPSKCAAQRCGQRPPGQLDALGTRRSALVCISGLTAPSNDLECNMWPTAKVGRAECGWLALATVPRPAVRLPA